MWNILVKVKWSRSRPGVAQRVGRGTALLFHDRGTRRGQVVSSTPRPCFTPWERPGTHFTVGWNILVHGFMCNTETHNIVLLNKYKVVLVIFLLVIIWYKLWHIYTKPLLELMQKKGPFQTEAKKKKHNKIQTMVIALWLTSSKWPQLYTPPSSFTTEFSTPQSHYY